MAKRIYKYNLEIINYQTIKLPIGYEILDIQEQNDKLVLWAIVDTELNGEEDVSFIIYGTGHYIPDLPNTYLKTVQTSNGSLVWHIFKEGERYEW